MSTLGLISGLILIVNNRFYEALTTYNICFINMHFECMYACVVVGVCVCECDKNNI